MAESKIADENYYQIQGFMINRLGLKGIALNVYAIIYGFTQDGENEYTGSLQYLCDFCGGVSKPTIINALKTLVEADYIFRREEVINGVKFNKYKVNLPLLKKFYYPDKEILTGAVKNLNGGGKKTLPNNKDNNKSINNSIIKKESKKAASASFDSLIEKYSKGDEEVKKLLGEWLKVRKAKRAAMTDYAIELNLKKIEKLSKESGMSVSRYLEEVIRRGWSAFYKINTYENNANNQSKTNNEMHSSISDDFLKTLKKCEDKFYKSKTLPFSTKETPRTAIEREAIHRSEEKAKNPPKTAADDPDIHVKMEKLKERLNGA